MKTRSPLLHMSAAARLAAILAGICACASPLRAQIANQPVPPPVQTTAPKLNAEELGQLLAPIALYPDALLAVILPASTVPPDVVLAARYLQSNGDPGHTENQPWDESVKSLVRYPEVLAWMDENLEWTASVGEAFVEQPADVMNAVQALREQAKAAGNLQDTPQQKVVVEEKIIRIVPADPEVIYVPVYDPQVVYVQSYTPVPALTFGFGFAVGWWLNYDFDWNRRCFYRGNWRGWNHDWNRNWNDRPNGYRGGNQVNVVNIDINNANQWQPSANARRQINQRQRNNNGNARYVAERSGTTGTGRLVNQGNANIQSTLPGNFHPEAKSPLPRPSKWEASTRRNRSQDPGRAGTPANPQPSTSAFSGVPSTAPEAGKNPNRSDRPRAQRPENTPQTAAPSMTPPLAGRGIPGSAPRPSPLPQTESRQERPNRGRPQAVPSTAPQVPGQINNPGLPRNEKSGPRKQPDRLSPVAPAPENNKQPKKPTAPAFRPTSAPSEPTKKRTPTTPSIPQAPQRQVPTANRPAQPPPQERQQKERPQPQRQQVQERKQPPQQQPSQQRQQPQRPQPRQQTPQQHRPEPVKVPAQPKKSSPSVAKPQAPAQPSTSGDSRKNKKER
ncbi:MAG: DUF3300 domain-containing protein [Terrimicrobiaceae bacterium]